MNCGITKLVLGYSPFIAITEDEYLAIKLAKDFLFEALYLEQKLNLVMEDYLEYEMMLLSKAAQHMIFQNLNYPRIQTEVNDINRRLVNLLSACRMYLDHCSHHLRNIYGDNSDKVEEVRNQKNIEHDSSLSYRVLEALRNHVQHRGFPVQQVTYQAQRENINEKDWHILFAVTPYIKVKELEKDKKFKKTVIEELKNIGEEIDIKPLVREHVTCIGNVHKKVRAVLRSDIQKWEESIQKCIQKFKDESNSEDIIGLGIAIQEEEGLYTESVQIFTDFIEHRQELEQKNSFAGSLARFYVTSKAVK